MGLGALKLTSAGLCVCRGWPGGQCFSSLWGLAGGPVPSGVDPYHRGGRPGCQGRALVLHRHLIPSAVILWAVGQ